MVFSWKSIRYRGGWRWWHSRVTALVGIAAFDQARAEFILAAGIDTAASLAAGVDVAAALVAGTDTAAALLAGVDSNAALAAGYEE